METILSKSRNTELSFNERFIMELSVLAVMCAAKLIMFGGRVSEPDPLDISSVSKILTMSNSVAF